MDVHSLYICNIRILVFKDEIVSNINVISEGYFEWICKISWTHEQLPTGLLWDSIYGGETWSKEGLLDGRALAAKRIYLCSVEARLSSSGRYAVHKSGTTRGVATGPWRMYVITNVLRCPAAYTPRNTHRNDRNAFN